MDTDPDRACVIGNGGWGTALALLLLSRGRDVALWGHSKEELDDIRARGENVPYLPGVTVPGELRLTDDPAEAAAGAGLVVVAAPSQFYETVCARFRGRLAPGADAVSVSKGFCAGTGDRLSVAAARALGVEEVAALSGPSHAEEVARGVPTAVVAAARDPALAARVQAAFNGPRFRVYTSDDPVGVELGGAVKNVLALAVGMSDGLGFGDNSRAALVTRGVAEMARLGVAVGGRAETFSGLSGLGDLVVTCTSRHSRNRGVGERLGRGEPLSAIQAGMRQVAEGVWNCTLVCDMAAELGVEMPICETVRLVLQGSIPPSEAVARLMGRDPKDERG